MSKDRQKIKINPKVVIWSLAGIACAAVFAFCIYCFVVVIPAKREADRLAYEEYLKQQEQQLTITPTATPELTEPPVPTATATPEPTEPALTEAPVVTEEPATTPTVTATPKITEPPAPTPTSTPTPTNTPTPTPTSTPTPSATPTPEPVVKVKAKVQMGDNVWYEFYEEGVLVVTGTGSTWDFDHTNSLATCLKEGLGENGSDYIGKTKTYEKTTKIVINEGVTGIGNFAMSRFEYVESITLPKSLEVIGESSFYYFGYKADAVTWIGLDLDNIEAATTSFYKAKGLEDITSIKEHQAKPTPTPTPLPPTPTPTPNPEQPKLLHTQQMGDNVTYELWDNGIVYIKGTGATWDVEYYSIEITSAKKVIVEEGIKYLGRCSLYFDFEELVLPKSLVKIHYDIGYMYAGSSITAYCNGAKISDNLTKKTDLSFYLRDNCGIKMDE